MRAGAITIKSGVDINGNAYLSFKTDEDFHQHLVVRGRDIDALRDVLRTVESDAIKQAHNDGSRAQSEVTHPDTPAG